MCFWNKNTQRKELNEFNNWSQHSNVILNGMEVNFVCVCLPFTAVAKLIEVDYFIQTNYLFSPSTWPEISQMNRLISQSTRIYYQRIQIRFFNNNNNNNGNNKIEICQMLDSLFLSPIRSKRRYQKIKINLKVIYIIEIYTFPLWF